jgi:hypothetical protein
MFRDSSHSSERIDPERFDKYLDSVDSIVSNMPEWKQNLLGWQSHNRNKNDKNSQCNRE